MKSIRILLVFFTITSINIQAQDHFHGQLSGGIPIGDFGDIATFAIGLDIAYLFEISESIEVGPSFGYVNAGGEEVATNSPFGPPTEKLSNISGIPIGMRGTYHISKLFDISLDGGYALGANKGNDGGAYLRPALSVALGKRFRFFVDSRFLFLENEDWTTFSFGFDIRFGDEKEGN